MTFIRNGEQRHSVTKHLPIGVAATIDEKYFSCSRVRELVPSLPTGPVMVIIYVHVTLRLQHL